MTKPIIRNFSTGILSDWSGARDYLITPEPRERKLRMVRGAVKIERGALELCRETGDVKIPVTASSSDVASVIKFQMLLERNPDFFYDPKLYSGQINSPQPNVFELTFTWMVSSGKGKQDRDLQVFDRLIGSLSTSMMKEGIRCYALAD